MSDARANSHAVFTIALIKDALHLPDDWTIKGAQYNGFDETIVLSVHNPELPALKEGESVLPIVSVPKL